MTIVDLDMAKQLEELQRERDEACAEVERLRGEVEREVKSQVEDLTSLRELAERFWRSDQSATMRDCGRQMLGLLDNLPAARAHMADTGRCEELKAERAEVERLRGEVDALERWLAGVGWGPRVWTRRRDSEGVKRPVRLTLLERVAGFVQEAVDCSDRWDDAPGIATPEPHPARVPEGHRWDECEAGEHMEGE